MGGSLEGEEGALSLFVWAAKDPDNAPLAKVQVIKSWIENGKRQEIVHDIDCGGSQLNAETGKCAANGAEVDIPDCRWTTCDSLRLRRVPPTDVPVTVTEMAWASPVWVKASRNSFPSGQR